LNLLLAFALVFSMFSTAVFAADSQSAAQKLVNAGIIKGSNSGDLMENETWKRQDVTVIISRLLGVEQEAKNTPKNHSFADVTDPYYDGFITYAYQNGYFNGHSEIRFGYGEEITVKQFAAVMLRVLGYDVAWDEVEEVAVDVGLVPAGTDFEEAATRGEYFVIIDTTLQTETADGEILGVALGLPGYAPEAPEVAVKAVGAKKIEVAFNKAVNKDQASITVKKGSNTVTVNSIKWSADNKTATIETAAKLTKGDYTITIKGVAESDYNLTLTAEDERVAAVQITNDKAPLADNNGTAIYAYFKATNQYGEDVTRSNTFTVSVSKGTVEHADPTTGTITGSTGRLKINAPQQPTPFNYSLNEQVYLSVTYVDRNGNFATDSKTLTVSAQARVAEVKFTELYNKDGKTLETATNLTTNEFYILIDAKDQYGNKVTAQQLNDDVLLSNTGAHIIKAEQFKAINDGVKENAIGLLIEAPSGTTPGQAGTARIMVASKTYNSTDIFDVEVVQSSMLDRLVIGAPEVLPVGEVVEIPFEAYDQNGEQITSASKIRSGISSLNLNGAGLAVSTPTNSVFYFEDDPVTGKAKLYLDTNGASNINVATPIVISGITQAHKPFNATLTAVPKARPLAVVKVDEVTGAVVKDGSTKIKLDKIFVEDQYGRTKTAEFFATNYNVTVTQDVYTYASLDRNVLDSNNTEATVTGLGTNGLTTITIAVDGVQNSDYKLRVRTVGINQIESYTVSVKDVYFDDDANPQATPATHQQKIEVKGLLSDGTTVAIPVAKQNDYMKVDSGYDGLGITNDGKVVVTDGSKLLTGNQTEKTFAIPFIGQTRTGAKTSVLEVKVSKAAPEAASFKLITPTSGPFNAKRASDTVINIVISDNDLATLDLKALANAVVEVKDQYGVAFDQATNDQFITASVASYPSTSYDSLDDVQVGESFKVVAFTKNAKQFEFTVKRVNSL
jgi:hypothetical protein